MSDKCRTAVCKYGRTADQEIVRSARSSKPDRGSGTHPRTRRGCSHPLFGRGAEGGGSLPAFPQTRGDFSFFSFFLFSSSQFPGNVRARGVFSRPGFPPGIPPSAISRIRRIRVAYRYGRFSLSFCVCVSFSLEPPGSSVRTDLASSRHIALAFFSRQLAGIRGG